MKGDQENGFVYEKDDHKLTIKFQRITLKWGGGGGFCCCNCGCMVFCGGGLWGLIEAKILCVLRIGQ